MNTSVSWTLVLAGPARRRPERIGPRDRERIHAALREMAADPFVGDVRYLRGQKDMLRRRVGDWRIFFRIVKEEKRLLVSAIEPRTSTTY